jgi:transposase
MEDILALYALPYDPAYPVICFDERPCFLIGDLHPPISMQPGQVEKEHYAYTKHGSCALLAAIEPLTGARFGLVRPRRTMAEFTEFCQELAARYPNATTIRLVLDNLNTHHAGAFYAHLPADEALALAQRFAFHYTPKGASWLNMIECEFSVISRQCLNRRIPTIEQLRTQILALLEERSVKQIKIHWQFSLENARTTMNRHYRNVNPVNKKYQKI